MHKRGCREVSHARVCERKTAREQHVNPLDPPARRRAMAEQEWNEMKRRTFPRSHAEVSCSHQHSQGHEREKEGHARHGRSALTTCDAMGAVLVYVVMRQKHRPHARLLGSPISPGFVSKLNTSLFLVPARHSHRLVEFTHQFTVCRKGFKVRGCVRAMCMRPETPVGARVDMKWVITSAHDHVTFGKKERVVHLDAWPPHCVLDGREKQWEEGVPIGPTGKKRNELA